MLTKPPARAQALELRQSAKRSFCGHLRDPAVGRQRSRATSAISSVRARWCIDVRYGVKAEAIALLQEWAAGIGSAAGLNLKTARLNSGAFGAPESRLELEAEFASLSDFEGFFGSIPQAAHKAWSERAQNYIIDGSPKWELYRACRLASDSDVSSSSAASSILKAWNRGSTARAELPTPAGEGGGKPDRTSAEPLQTPTSSADEDEPKQEPRIVLDWKGDPMTINPGDRMPL